MPLSVQLSTMSQSSHRNISGFIKTKGKTHFQLNDQQEPDVVILDIDSEEGKSLLAEYQNKKIQVIALSLYPLDKPSSSVIHIKKPITSIELIRAAEKINTQSKNRVQSSDNRINTAITPEQAIDDSQKKSRKESQKNTVEEIDDNQRYEPSQTLQGMLRRAIQLSDREKTNVVLRVQRYCIEIDANKKRARLNFSPNRLRNLCHVQLSSSSCRISKESLTASLSEFPSFSLTELSWNTALLCSRGRLAKSLSDDSIYQLKAWPNLTRWNVPQHALKIASLWSKSPSSITSISQQLSIPIADVRGFIIAALDSHLAIINEQASNIVPFKTEKKNSTLFKKLLNRLNRA